MPPSAHQRAAGRPGASGVQASPEDAVLRRTPDGWRVGAEDVPDLTCAMVLADLLAAELAADESAEHAAALEQDEEHSDGQLADGKQADGKHADGKHADDVQPDGTSAGESATDETRRLKATVGQLQHALTARIRVEQAIGVLAERHRIRPRQAFEQLRSAARNRGRRVADIAADVVASASNPLLQLPDELARTRSGSRSGGRQRRLVDPNA
jgi:hypothetical protein